MSKKLLVVARSTTAHPGHGGMETATANLVEAFSDSGWSLGLMTTAGGDQAMLGHRFEKIWVIPGTRAGKYSLRWWLGSARFNQYRSWRPDAVLSVSVSGAMVARRLRDVPSVAISHGTAVGDFLSRWQGLRAAGSLRAGVGQLSRAAVQFGRIARDMFAYRQFPHVVAVSDGVRTQLSKPPLLLPHAATLVLPNLVAAVGGLYSAGDRQQVRTAYRIQSNESVWLLAGRVDVEKGVLEAVDGIAEMEDGTRLIIVGDGPALAQAKARAISRRVSDRVNFIGRVPPGDVHQFLSAADVLLVPSHRVEGLPMVVLEAMQAGLPIVASQRANVPPVDGKVSIFSTVSGSTIADRAGGVTSAEQSRTSYLPAEFEHSRVIANYERLLRNA